jgi:DnaJ family protein A protein 2
MFFGGGAGGGPGNPNKSKPMLHKLGISLEELYSGKIRKLAANRDLKCDECDGKGGKSVKKCTECQGMGVKLKTRQMGPMVQQMQVPCAVCEQRGEIIGGPKCKTCKGKRTLRDKKILEVRTHPNNFYEIIFK